MLRSLLSMAVRFLFRNKVHSLINVLSLTLGLTVFSLLMLYVKHELTYDRSWPNSENIHRVVIDREDPTTGVFSSNFNFSHDVLQWLRDDFPLAIEASTRARLGAFALISDGQAVRQNLTLVDPEFLDVFSIEVVAGDLGRAVSNPRVLAVEESIARQFLGPSPVGERLELSRNGEVALEFEVGAVFRLAVPTPCISAL